MKTNIPNNPVRQGGRKPTVAVLVKVNAYGEIVDVFPGTCQAWAEPILKNFYNLHCSTHSLGNQGRFSVLEGGAQ
jgi:hypothetical protein